MLIVSFVGLHRFFFFSILKNLAPFCQSVFNKCFISPIRGMIIFSAAKYIRQMFLVNQAIYLLKRQIEKLEQDFVEEGGFTEKLYRVRTQRKRRQ